VPDPFLDDPDEAETNTDGNPTRDMREHIARLEKDLKEQGKRAAKAEAALQETEARQRASSAQAFGLSESQAKAFLSLNPESEVNAESVKGFADSLGISLGTSDQTAQEAEEPEVETPAFRPVSGSEPSKTQVAWGEFKKLLVTDQARAIQMASEGLVEGIEPD
jgi:dsDNA-specific endonuclease/ATPase MutS2